MEKVATKQCEGWISFECTLEPGHPGPHRYMKGKHVLMEWFTDDRPDGTVEHAVQQSFGLKTGDDEYDERSSVPLRRDTG